MSKINQLKNAGMIVSGVATATLIAGCGGPVDEWKNAPGTNGFINLDDVKKAFVKNKSAEDFEKRVNEVFEGDNLVVFRCQKLSKGGFIYIAYEDLNKDKKVTNSDDKLFTLTVANRKATLKGFGVNKYYSKSWAYTPPGEKKEETYYRSHYHHHHFGFWYWGRSWPHYYTPRQRYDGNYAHRTAYRKTPGFVKQVKTNAGFEKSAAAKYGSGFRKSSSALSKSRSASIKKASSSSAFKKQLSSKKASSGWGIRSSQSISSSYSSAKSTSSKSSVKSSRGGSYRGSRGSSGFGV